MQAKSPSNIKGIDVSRYQGEIDWGKVAADGIRFAFIKATDGSGYVDPKLQQNAAGAKAVGLKIGYYHYCRAEKYEAEIEAAHFAQSVKGLPCDFPLVLDVEGEAAKIGSALLTAWCARFLAELKRLSNRDVMIYTGASFARSYLGKQLAGFPVWIAHYGTDDPMNNPTWATWSVFQYTSSGRVAGIAGNVDMNAMEKTFFDKYTCSGSTAAVKKPEPLSAEDTIKVVVNDELAAFGRNIDGRIYVPIGQLGKALEAKVSWDNVTKKVYLYH